MTLGYARAAFAAGHTAVGLGNAARAIVETAREQVAALVNARPGEVVFTSGATEANTFAINGRPWRALLVGRMRRVLSCRAGPMVFKI